MAEERVERRLAAVLAADVAGYSRLMGSDEEGTLARLKALRKAFVDPTIAAHRGRIVNTAGDAMMVEFASAVDAVRSAVEIQHSLTAQNDDVPQDKKIEIRIGIHIGDIIFDGSDIFGDGVNIAARLEGISEPGGVCISDDAHRYIRGKVDLEFDDMGPQTLKNIAEPMRAWRIVLPGQQACAGGSGMAERPALALPDKPSIAVLPFENMSGDPEQEYFADGVVEDIITALSRVRAFFVIARNSSFAYKGRVVDVRQVGRELGVRYILEGSIRKAGNIVRITGQLVEAATRTHIWADKFDGELNQIFELQDRITESVVTSIEPSVRNTEIERTRNKPPGSLTAYDLYLRAQPEFHTYTRDGFLRARELLEQALALDPNFGDAWTSLADCLGRLLLGGWLEPVGQGRRLVCESALKAVSIDPRNGPALAMAAWATAIAGDNPTRAAEFAEQALRIHPNSAYVRTMSAFGFLYNEQFDKARQNLELALRFSPMDVRSYTMYIGIANCHLFSKNFPEAIGWAERAVEKGPTFAVALRVLATALALDGRIDAARNACKNLLAAQPNASISWILQRPVGSPWMMELIVDGLRRAGLPE